MKKTLFILPLLSVLLFGSCKKDDNNNSPKTTSIQGLWIGTYVDSRNTPEYFSFVIKPDGTTIVENRYLTLQNFAKGTWTLNGNSFSCTHTYFSGPPANIGTVQQCTATFDNTGKLASGMIQNISPSTLTATFTMTKVN